MEPVPFQARRRHPGGSRSDSHATRFKGPLPWCSVGNYRLTRVGYRGPGKRAFHTGQWPSGIDMLYMCADQFFFRWDVSGTSHNNIKTCRNIIH